MTMIFLRGAAIAALFFSCFAFAAGPCADLTKPEAHPQQLIVTDAKPIAAGPEAQVGYCPVHGQLGAHRGVDGKGYAIRFEMRLPDDWNGHVVHQFNGGNDGKVIPATGPLLGGDKTQTALGRGYGVKGSISRKSV